MRAPRLALLTSALIVGAVALTACAPGGEAPVEKSPFEKLFSEIDGANMSDEEREQQMQEQNAKMEELVAECMTDEGFDYTPADMGIWAFSSGDEWKPDDREWVSQYGYGAINWPGRDEMNAGGREEYVDPNADYVASLSESEQAAYYEALYGPMIESSEGSVDMETEWNWETAGCYGWAQNQNEEVSIWNSDEAEAFNEAMNEFYENQSEDPKMDSAHSDWSNCMADAGHTGFAKQEDAQNSIYDELNSYYENQTEYIENDPELEKLGETEIELALADLDCRTSTNYTKRAQEVQFAAEQKFIDENRAVIDAFLAVAVKK